MACLTFVVTEEIVRFQTVELDVPDDLLVDGEVPDYLTEPDKSQVYEEWVTEHVYLEAHTQGDWDTRTKDSDWEGAS